MINAERRFEHGEMREAWLNGEPLAQIDTGSPEVVTYLHTDHLATPRFGTNAAGSTVWTWDSGAFGKEAATGSATVNLRFPGQYYDAEAGLHYNWNRYYNPATGRYVSSDPIGLAGGLATYTYVSASPVMFGDPRGLLQADEKYPNCYFGFLPMNSPCLSEMNNASDRTGKMYGGGWAQEATVSTDNGRERVKVYINAPHSNDRFDTNCHGLTFSGGKYWIQGDYGTIKAILRGDGYTEITDRGLSLMPGDVILFDNGKIYTHSVTVKSVDDNGNVTVYGIDGADLNPTTESLGDVESRFPTSSKKIFRK